ncbi:MAG: hypothetical protein ACFFC7_17470 [Candidatus Hermodarchaeota archaeon]
MASVYRSSPSFSLYRLSRCASPQFQANLESLHTWSAYCVLCCLLSARTCTPCGLAVRSPSSRPLPFEYRCPCPYKNLPETDLAINEATSYLSREVDSCLNIH